MTDLRVSVRNLSDNGGTFTTPFYFGFHDGAFDLFDTGEAASAGLEALAEDGNFSVIAGERLAVSPDSQGLVVTGAVGPIATQELTSATTTIDGSVNAYVSFGAMILPSNDAFVGTNDAIALFDEDGNFLGAQSVLFESSNVYDAGTEYNTEEDAAFLNQAGPNEGLTEGGVIRLHEGFNGSLGNPDGILGNPAGSPGAQNILGGTNAFGEFIDPVAADFTQPGAQIAEVHINTVNVADGDAGNNQLIGGADDDIFSGGDGNDLLLGRDGWDELNGDVGRDVLLGGRGDDILNGGSGFDILNGHAGRDNLDGGNGRDIVRGGSGEDLVAGGAQDDILRGGSEADTFVFTEGDGRDRIIDYTDGEDQIALAVDGIADIDDVQAVASMNVRGVVINFGDGDALALIGADVSSLDSGDFIFA